MSKRCCWSKPQGESPPTQYNAISFDSAGDLRWKTRWEAIDGELFGGMTVFVDSRNQHCIRVVGTVLVAIGEKSGNVYAAGLNIADGTESFALLDTGQAYSGTEVGNCISTGTEIILSALRETSTGPVVQRYAIDATGTIDFDESSTVGGGAFGRDEVGVNTAGDVVGVNFPGVGIGAFGASVDGAGESGTDSDTTRHFDHETLRFAGTDAYIYGFDPNGVLGVEGAWYESPVPLTAFAALTADDEHLPQLFGGLEIHTRSTTVRNVSNANRRVWVTDHNFALGGARVRYFDMEVAGDTKLRWTHSLHGPEIGADNVYSFDANEQIAVAVGNADFSTPFVVSITETGSYKSTAGLFTFSGARAGLFDAFANLTLNTPAADIIHVSHDQGFLSNALRSMQFDVSSGAFVKDWEWNGGMTALPTTDGSANYYGAADHNFVMDVGELGRVV